MITQEDVLQAIRALSAAREFVKAEEMAREFDLRPYCRVCSAVMTLDMRTWLLIEGRCVFACLDCVKNDSYLFNIQRTQLVDSFRYSKVSEQDIEWLLVIAPRLATSVRLRAFQFVISSFRATLVATRFTGDKGTGYRTS
jgi:hypothetical protein